MNKFDKKRDVLLSQTVFGSLKSKCENYDRHEKAPMGVGLANRGGLDRGGLDAGGLAAGGLAAMPKSSMTEPASQGRAKVDIQR
eukprot:5132208-Amphidinium_carterae.1